jgi:hypothetical protein
MDSGAYQQLFPIILAVLSEPQRYLSRSAS